MKKRAKYALGCVLAGATLGSGLAAPVSAVDVGGSLRVTTGTTKTDGVENDEEDQAFQLFLSQELSPYLTLFGSFRSTQYRTRFDQSNVFERSSEQPEIGLSYDRNRLQARLLFTDRAVRTTDENQDLDSRNLLASLDWRPNRGPRLGFRFQDATSTADAALVGRDSRSRDFSFQADYLKANWSARYSFNATDLENKITGLSLEQIRHEIRSAYFESLWNNRWTVTVDARLADESQEQDAPTGGEVSLEVPAVQGLYAIDSTPSLGQLEPAAQLIDGDTTLPAAPGIEIGGANTFRNIGVDLGISRAVSELEISVDAPSGALVWQVWESPDNSSWFQVSGSVSFFDAGFLRYTIEFPETTARYFKAVNVSVNPILDVLVTEVRALQTTTQLERAEGSGTEYWLNLQTSLRPTDRIEISVGANVRRDQDLVATELRRSYDEQGLSALLRFDLAADLELRLGYTLAELDENLDPAVERRNEVTTAALDWRPLETINALLTAQQREETAGGEVLSSSDSLVLQGVLEIFPDLISRSTFGLADSRNLLFGFSQETRYFIETLEARPNDRWLLTGSFSRYDYDSEGSLAVTFRTSAEVRAAWFATPFLSLSGEWLVNEDDVGDTNTQRLGLQWTPGPKLSLSTHYYDTESSRGTGTANFSFDGNYRVNRWVRLWLAVNEAESSFTMQETTRTEAVRLGFTAIF